MPRYDNTFVDRFLEPWNRHDVDGALALTLSSRCLRVRETAGCRKASAIEPR